MKRIALFAATIALLTACMGPVTEAQLLPLNRAQISEIEEAVAYRMRDPQSAQFRNIRYIERTHQSGEVSLLVCGQVNARNGFGGYAGFAGFTGTFENGSFKIYGIGNPDNLWLYESSCGA